jgi:hypothetical protein
METLALFRQLGMKNRPADVSPEAVSFFLFKDNTCEESP